MPLQGMVVHLHQYFQPGNLNTSVMFGHQSFAAPRRSCRSLYSHAVLFDKLLGAVISVGLKLTLNWRTFSVRNPDRLTSARKLVRSQSTPSVIGRSSAWQMTSRTAGFHRSTCAVECAQSLRANMHYQFLVSWFIGANIRQDHAN